MPTPTKVPAESPDVDHAFPRLGEEQINALEQRGTRRRTHHGDILFREGDRLNDLFVILEGRVGIFAGYGKENRLVAVHGKGRFLGELGILSGQVAFVTAVVQEPGEILVVPADRLKEVLTQDAALGDLILRACLARRWAYLDAGVGFRIIGSHYSADARRLGEFAARNRLPHTWIDLEDDPGAEALLEFFGVTPEETPIVVWRGAVVMRNPSNAELARLIGLPALQPKGVVADVVIVGAGPAGLATAVYAASEGLATVVIDAVAAGGQASLSARIENYLGFPAGISGAELAERAVIQATKFDASITVPAEAIGFRTDNGHHVVELSDRDEFVGRTVVIATGARYRRLEVPRVDVFEGRYIHHAATPVEGRRCRGEPVAVVGGGNSAGQASVFLAQHAAHVHLLMREDTLDLEMSRYLADRIRRIPNIEVHQHCEVRELTGQHALEGVVVQDTRTGRLTTVNVGYLFVFIGVEPHASWLAGAVALDDHGFVLTGAAAVPGIPTANGAGPTQLPRLLETSCAGVFAVGDVRSGSIKRVASAVGEGSTSVPLIHEYLAGFTERHGGER
ncbi:MAG: thioredoxin reductase [Actinomycetota bacterium]|nr:thioredoxin reductase [Actinomycetota bacterium]